MRYLFVVGCSRTGTTAMGEFLNKDERIILGVERYKKIGKKLTLAHFEKDRFFDISADDTNVLGKLERRSGPLKERWDRGGVAYVGDKSPNFYRFLPHLTKTFPGCKVVFMYRGLYAVASSFNVKAYNPKSRWPETGDYRKAVVQWNESLQCLKDFVASRAATPVFIAKYDRFYANNRAYLEALYDYLELPLTDAVVAAYEADCAGWEDRLNKPLTISETMALYLDRHKDTALEQWVEAQLPAVARAADEPA